MRVYSIHWNGKRSHCDPLQSSDLIKVLHSTSMGVVHYVGSGARGWMTIRVFIFYFEREAMQVLFRPVSLRPLDYRSRLPYVALLGFSMEVRTRHARSVSANSFKFLDNAKIIIVISNRDALTTATYFILSAHPNLAMTGTCVTIDVNGYVRFQWSLLKRLAVHSCFNKYIYR